MVYKYITKHCQAISEASLDGRKYATGFKEMLVLNKELSNHLAPPNFRWANHYLYTLYIGNVELVPVSPSEDEKNKAWNFHKEANSKVKGQAERDSLTVEPGALGFDTFVQEDLSVNLQVPYISYTRFQSTKSSKSGVPYLEYVKAPEMDEISRVLPRIIYPSEGTLVPKDVGEENDVTSLLNLNVGKSIELEDFS